MRELAHYPQGVTGTICPFKEGVVQAETSIPLFAHWTHLHSSEMLLAMGPIAAHLLQERETLARIVKANFSSFSENQMTIFAARRLLTAKALGLMGSRTVMSASIETSVGAKIHLLGLEKPDKPVDSHVEKNHIVSALASGFGNMRRNGDTLYFPIHPVSIGVLPGETPFSGVALAHELIMQTWAHFLTELIPNRGFAAQVDYDGIPNRSQVAAADQLQISSANWQGIRTDGKPFHIVNIPFVFSQGDRVVCTGTYKHLHPNSVDDRNRMLRDAGIISYSC